MPFSPPPLTSPLLGADAHRNTFPYDAGPGIRPIQGAPDKTISFPYDQSTRPIPVVDCHSGRFTVPYDAGGLRVTHPSPGGMQSESRNDVGEWPTKIVAPAICRCTNPVDRPAPVSVPAQSRSSLSFDSYGKIPWCWSAEVRQAYEFYNMVCREMDPDLAKQLLREFIVLPATRQALKDGCLRALPNGGSRRSDWNDFLQNTCLDVWDRLEAERKGHRDGGLLAFAALLLKICHDAAVDIVRRDLRSRRPEIAFVDPEKLAGVAAPREQVHPREQLNAGIEEIRHPKVKAAMSDLRNGFSVETTAAELGVCTRTVNRLRQQGFAELRKFFADESDHDS